jgi:hypothetical protein
MYFISRKLKILVPILLLAPFSMIGCGGGSGGGSGGGGGGGGGTSDAAITMLPAGFNFGLVTEGNLDKVIPREFVISNTGTDSYTVSNIRLVNENPDEFILNERGGEAPCNALTFSLDPGSSCTVTVRFAPALTNFGSFRAALLVQTNDPNADSIARSLAGTYAKIQSINVAVNQINACPRSQPAQAFLSVTDQAGFPLKDLASGDFTLEELGFGLVSNPVARPVGESDSIALSIVMDYSSSITNFPSAVSNMQEGATLLVDAMRANDEADIIKYADVVKVMTTGGFTSDKDALKAAIAEDPGLIQGTAFYDATVVAIERLQFRDTERRVVINLTDGEDTASQNADLASTITDALATNIPIFTVGFGSVDPDVLREMADDTGGLFYNPAGDANLQQIAQQLTALFFNDQYVITFDSALAESDSASLGVTANFVKDGTPFQGEGSRTILACP